MFAQEIKSMPAAERIILMEELWNTLCNEKTEIKSPGWHKEILEERIDLINSNKAEFISIRELKSHNL
ncbi:MAG: addiction module protein [Deltaproteobacteria bacterium]|nr:addiction module protein [Deltaproteobacteria bacterium]